MYVLIEADFHGDVLVVERDNVLASPDFLLASHIGPVEPEEVMVGTADE